MKDLRAGDVAGIGAAQLDTRPATSSAVPIRPIGMREISASYSGQIIAVSISPGD
jgi:hypothetical protein